MNQMEQLFALAWSSTIIKLVVLLVLMDMVFGSIRAIREHKFNSCCGIDGAIRKISMIVAIAFLLIFDKISGLNFISLVPEEIRGYIKLNTIGASEFFGLFFLAYEVVSILKNMTLCGLPVKKLWDSVRKFLQKYTNELPDDN